MELVISIVIGILIVEAYAWMPKISGWLIEREVRRLRREDQNRCREEWRAGLDALPNSVAKLIHALSYLGAAHRINGDFYKSKLDEINAIIEEYDQKYSDFVVSIRAWKEFDKSQYNVDFVDWKARVMLLPRAEMRTFLESLVVTLESFSDTIFHGIDRVKGFMTVSNDRVAERTQSRK